MVSLEVKIVNELGMHARAAARFVQESSKLLSEIWLIKGSNRVNGKSIMGILTLAAAKGEIIVIEADGPDEEDAIKKLGDMVASGFNE